MITEILDTDQHRLVHSLALNRSPSHAFRLRLARHPSIRAALVIGSQDAPPALVEPLIDDPDVRVREYLAQSEWLPPHLHSRLAADPAPKIRATLARWLPEAPIEVRRALLTDTNDDVRADNHGPACA